MLSQANKSAVSDLASKAEQLVMVAGLATVLICSFGF